MHKLNTSQYKRLWHLILVLPGIGLAPVWLCGSDSCSASLSYGGSTGLNLPPHTHTFFLSYFCLWHTIRSRYIRALGRWSLPGLKALYNSDPRLRHVSAALMLHLGVTPSSRTRLQVVQNAAALLVGGSTLFPFRPPSTGSLWTLEIILGSF